MTPIKTLAEHIKAVGVEQARQEVWLVRVMPSPELTKVALQDISPSGRCVAIGGDHWYTTDRVELIEKLA